MAKAAKKPSPKSPSKSDILTAIAEATSISKKDVSAVMEALSGEIRKAIGKKGPGAFTIPGLVKVIRKEVPARPAKKGVMVLGQLRDLPAKPASVKVTVRALKPLKAML
ncbi:MAG: HU family DNA-binding protein [Pirellulales bacterium]|nr:HU family DNA-binding protein [Pirellulales bacterium]